MRWCVAIVLSATAAFGCDRRIESLAERGEHLMFERNYREAVREFEVLLHECGDKVEDGCSEHRIDANMRIGEIQQHYLGDLQSALRAYRAAARLAHGTPRGFEARLAAARLLRNALDDPKNASLEMTALLEAYPEHDQVSGYQLEAARVAFRARRYELAKKQAQAAMKSGEGAIQLDAAMLSASIDEVEGRPEAAFATYESLAEVPMKPELLARVRFEAAHCLELMGELKRALDYYRTASEGSGDAELVAARITRLENRLQLVNTPRPKRGGFHAARDSSGTPDLGPNVRTRAKPPPRLGRRKRKTEASSSGASSGSAPAKSASTPSTPPAADPKPAATKTSSKS